MNAKTETSAPVDVLAVMRNAAFELRTVTTGNEGKAADKLDEARAAVAELVEALRESDAALTLCRARWPFQPSPAQMPAYTATMAAKARIAAALAKFGGA